VKGMIQLFETLQSWLEKKKNMMKIIIANIFFHSSYDKVSEIRQRMLLTTTCAAADQKTTQAV
jgi:hypothetical protein